MLSTGKLMNHGSLQSNNSVPKSTFDTSSLSKINSNAQLVIVSFTSLQQWNSQRSGTAAQAAVSKFIKFYQVGLHKYFGKLSLRSSSLALRSFLLEISVSLEVTIFIRIETILANF